MSELELKKCDLEKKWVVDIAIFLGVFMVNLMLGLIPQFNIYLLIIGVLFSFAKSYRFLLAVVVSICFAIIWANFGSATNIELFFSSLGNFFALFLSNTLWIILGFIIGSVSYSVYNYQKCKKGR